MDTHTHEVQVSTSLAAAVARVYELFSKPDHVSRWFTTNHEAEVVPGGAYKNGDGDHGRYLRVAAPDLLEFTWENAGHCPGTVVTVSFVGMAEDTTVVRLRHHQLASVRDVEDMRGGWSWALASFKSYVETGQPIRHEDWLARHAAGGPSTSF